MYFNFLKNSFACLILAATLFLNVGITYAAPITIVTSFSILGDLVKQIGGDKVIVTSIVGADQDTHDYELKPSDVTKIDKSRMFIINGLGLETNWSNNLVQSYKGVVVVASNGVIPFYFNDKKTANPHAWGDPNNVRKYYMQNILRALIKISPENSSFFKKRAYIYANKLTKLDELIVKELSKISPEKARAVVTHSSFKYFSATYGVKLTPVEGTSIDNDVSAKDIADLEKVIKQTNIKVVFLENMTNNTLTQQIAKDTKVKIGGKLYSDALSDKNGPASDYIDMMVYNLNTLKKAWK